MRSIMRRYDALIGVVALMDSLMLIDVLAAMGFVLLGSFFARNNSYSSAA